MEFLDKLVLPQSAEHIELLHYMLMLIQFLFIPFISLLFAGTALSLLFRRRYRKYNNRNFLIFSKDVIELVTGNNGIGVILGIVPLFTAILIFTQLLHTTNTGTVTYFGLSFLFTLVGIIMIYTYRHSFVVNFVFESFNDKRIDDKIVEEEFGKIKNKASFLSKKYGKLGIVFLFLGMWFYTAGVISAATFSVWNAGNIFAALFNIKVLLAFSLFIFLAFAITGSFILFIFFFWKDNREEIKKDYLEFIRENCARITLKSGIPIPFIVALNLFLVPSSFLSGSVFGYTIFGILLIFLGYNFLYAILQKGSYKLSPLLFFVFIFASFSFIVKDQLTISNATELHSVVLSTEYQKILADLKGEGGTAEINGKEIYDVRCASCHKFEQKLVGPAHLDVLPKYVGKESQLVAFIRNPVKVDPAYPPMPNPGLKPQEAEAVAKYLLEEYEKKKAGK